MKIICNKIVLGEVPYRPIAIGAIIRYGKKNYDVQKATHDVLIVTVRGGAFGQAATPDYVIDAINDTGYPRAFLVCLNFTDDYVGEVKLDKPPEEGQIIKFGHKTYTIVDWSIGQRRVDELYVVQGAFNGNSL